jgi:integrase
MPTLSYEIVATEVKPFTYRPPFVVINDNGIPQLNYSNDKNLSIYIKRITFLNWVGRDKLGNIVSYEPMDYVNRFLMTHHIDYDKQESDQYSRGLIHFFSFLIQLQERWDQEYNEDLFDELIDPPRPSWDYMTLRKAHRITYRYREALKYSVLREPDKNLRLARTTATAYMNAVTKFYSFHLRNGYQFNNPPFNHEIITINFQANAASMKAYMSKDVHTTDLRLKFPRSKRNEGGSLPDARRDLSPFTNEQWKAAENILLNTKRVLKNVKGCFKLVQLAEEYCLFFLISRYTGLRKEEVASLHCGQIVKPQSVKSILRMGVGDEYGSLTKTKGNWNKSRVTIIPSSIMKLLYEYKRSIRYQKRLVKFRALCKAKHANGDDAFFESVDGVDENKEYVFISNTGIPFFLKLSELNNRWNEVKTTINEILGQEVLGSIHNLRATFAVSVFRILLTKIPAEKALALVSDLLGHEDIATTILYLNIAQNKPTGDQIYEDILDYIGIFDDIEHRNNI